VPDALPSSLAGPPSISLSRHAPFRPRTALDFTPVTIALVNTGTAPLRIARLDCDPLLDSETGAAMPARLTAEAASLEIPPGGTARVTLAGQVPARAGVYAATFRVQGEDGAALAIPLTVTIGASPLRGILCTLLGLLLAGLIGMLQTESDLHARRANLLQARADTEDWRRRNPIPSTLAANWDAYDAAMQAAQRLLSQRRPLSVVDWRIAMAQDRQRVAEDELKTIKEAMKDAPPGAAEVAELDAAWKTLQGQFQPLAERPEDLPGATADTLARRLAAFLAAFRGGFLTLPVHIESAEIGTYVTLTDLTLAAGQREAARRQAIEVRRWLERAAHDLGLRLTTLADFENLANSLLIEDATLRRRLADPAIPDDTRRTLIAALDAAEAGIGAGTALPDLAAAYGHILEIGTGFLRIQAEIMVRQVQEAVARVNAATDEGPVNEAMDVDPPAPHDPPERRAAWMARVLAAWRKLVATVPDPATQRDLDSRLDTIEALRAQGNLKATSAPYKAFLQAWTDDALRRVQAASRAAEGSFCRDFGEDLRRTLAETEANMRLIAAPPGREGWEASIDRIRLRAGAVPDADCLAVKLQRKEGSFTVEPKPASPLFELRAEANALAREVFTTALNATPLPAAARLGAAEASGVPEAIALARRLLAGPRPLTLATVPGNGLTAGQPIRFDVGNLDPAWGAGVLVAIDYGDRTPPEQRSAEALRKEIFVHIYAAPLPATVRVAAATGFQPRSLEAAEELLGAAALPVAVADSPVRLARALADAFINARFALALAIALLVYVWQFQAKQPDFGRHGFDYVKAFALGFAVEAAASNLPEVLNKIALG